MLTLPSKRRQANGRMDAKECSCYLLWFRSVGHPALRCPFPSHSSPKQLSLQPTTMGQKQKRSNRSPRNNPPQNDNQSMHLIKLSLFLFQCTDLRPLFLQVKLYIIHLLERENQKTKTKTKKTGVTFWPLKLNMKWPDICLLYTSPSPRDA